MREILFRGKRKDNGAWETGSLIIERMYTSENIVQIGDKMTAYPTPVIPETVGQFTGETDKNGKKIFEGDICHFCGGEYYSGFWELNRTCEITFCHECLWYLENAEYVNVVGNIFDNPELLKGEAEE